MQPPLQPTSHPYDLQENVDEAGSLNDWVILNEDQGPGATASDLICVMKIWSSLRLSVPFCQPEVILTLGGQMEIHYSHALEK